MAVRLMDGLERSGAFLPIEVEGVEPGDQAFWSVGPATRSRF